MKNITLFTKNGCPQCRMTRNYLSTHNIPFTERNINNEPEAVNYLKAQGFKAVPVVEADGMDAFSGFRPDVLAKLG